MIGIPPSEVCAAGPKFVAPADAAEWVDAEAGNLLAAARQAMTAPERRPIVVALSAAAAGPLNVRGYTRTLAELARLAIDAARTLPDDRGLAQAHHDLALGCLGAAQLGALDHAERALRFWCLDGDLVGQAAALNNLGIIWLRSGDTDRALAQYGRALDLRRRLGHRDSQAAILTNMSEVLAQRDEFGRASRISTRRSSCTGRRPTSAARASSSGPWARFTCKRAGPTAPSATSSARSRWSTGRAGGLFEADFSWHLGACQGLLGRHDQALTCRRLALGILQRTGSLTTGEVRALLADPAPETPHQIR